MKIFCHIPNQFSGFRELESFNRTATSNWSKTGQIYPMYDPDTMEIFECGFNPESGEIVAFATVSIAEFRNRLEKQAEEILQDKIQKAVSEASEEVAKIHSAIAFAEKLYMMF